MKAAFFIGLILMAPSIRADEVSFKAWLSYQKCGLGCAPAEFQAAKDSVATALKLEMTRSCPNKFNLSGFAPVSQLSSIEDLKTKVSKGELGDCYNSSNKRTPLSNISGRFLLVGEKGDFSVATCQNLSSTKTDCTTTPVTIHMAKDTCIFYDLKQGYVGHVKKIRGSLKTWIYMGNKNQRMAKFGTHLEETADADQLSSTGDLCPELDKDALASEVRFVVRSRTERYEGTGSN